MNGKDVRLVVRRSLFVGNQLVRGGEGGAALWGAGEWVIENSTFTGNQSRGPGGAINAAGSLSIYNSTIVDNSSLEAQAGGIRYRGSSILHVVDTIVAGNVGGRTGASSPDCENTESAPPTGGFNLVGTSGISYSCFAGTTNVAGKAHDLGPLADNGGPTETRVPNASSPAVDRGDLDGCKGDQQRALTDDQRGHPRPAGGRCDIGAVER